MGEGYLGAIETLSGLVIVIFMKGRMRPDPKNSLIIISRCSLDAPCRLLFSIHWKTLAELCIEILRGLAYTPVLVKSLMANFQALNMWEAALFWGFFSHFLGHLVR